MELSAAAERLWYWLSGMPERRDLQAREGHVGGVQVDRQDAPPLVGEVVEDVAAGGRDGENPARVVEAEGLGVDPGVLPNLRVDESLEPQGEQSLQGPDREKRR